MWRLKHVSKSNDNKDDNKIALANTKFKGKCYGCGKTQHKKNNCPEKKSDRSNNKLNKKTKKRFKGKCRACGIKRYKAAKYWTKNKNQNKAPVGYLEKLKAKKQAKIIEMVLASFECNNQCKTKANKHHKRCK